MADFFDIDESITKGYDSGIVGRIFAYLRPYAGIAVVTILTLAISTAGELYIPVLVKDTVDGALVVTYSMVAPGLMAGSEPVALPEDPILGGRSNRPQLPAQGHPGKPKAGIPGLGRHRPG